MDVDSQQYGDLQLRIEQAKNQPPSVSQENEPLANEGLLQAPKRQTEDSFVSAKEAVSAQPSRENLREEDDEDDATVPDENSDVTEAPNGDATLKPDEEEDDEEPNVEIHEDEMEEDDSKAEDQEEIAQEDESVISDASSPDKPIMRKSSLNFASLPPRETLTGKPSIGARISHMNSQPVMSGALDVDPSEEFIENPAAEYNKASTQSLQDRIKMLGQTKEPRPSKSIPQAYPKLPSVQPASQPAEARKEDDEEDQDADDTDWIAPIESRPSTAESVTEKHATEQEDANPKIGHQKSISTTNIPSPTKSALEPFAFQKAFSASQPNFAPGQQISTPVASPASKKYADGGPLSASKSRLYSVLKSAKSMFASSAGASASAKMEAMGSPVAKQSKQNLAAAANEPDMSKMPGGFGDDFMQANTATSRPLSVFGSLSSKSPSRKTRSSTESDKRKDKETKEKQRGADNLEKIREAERKKAAEQKSERERIEREETERVEKERAEAESRSESQASEEPTIAEEASVVVGGKAATTAGKLRAPTRLGRPTRQPSQQTKPAPVNIRVASQSQRLGSVQPGSTEPVPPPGRQPALGTRAGAATTRAGSAQPANARVKALEAAARKKEQEEKVAERKAEQKREFERKRVAKAEEERRLDLEKKAAEQQKIQDAKIAAQKQAEQRKLEQQRKEAAAVAKSKAEADLAAALEREKAQAAPPPPRGDVQGTLRQLGKSTAQEPQINTAKPVKRPLQQEDEASSRPGLPRGPPSYQQQDAKRRRTNEEDDVEVHERHSVMAPPKRPSNMRKVRPTDVINQRHYLICSQETLSKFPHGYSHAPPPAAHHNPNMFKATVTAQHQLQHPGKAPMHPNDTIKLSNARIPFAENANPPAQHVPHYYPQPPTIPSSSSSAFKTPARPVHPGISKAKSSPAYANGENIALPEINTDSEDSESDDEDNATGGFRAPSWVASPALRDLLTQQQLMDPEAVFGPIAPLQMDEVFKNSKNPDRMKRFRDRGESALWTETGDAVTSAEKKRDREMRAKVARDGGWTFSRD